MTRGLVTIMALALCAGGAEAAPMPSCAPPVEVANLPINRVEPNAALISTDGRAVKLEGLLLPGGARDRAPQFLADQARSELTTMVKGHLLTLAAQPPKQDRYGRIRAQVFLTDDDSNEWVQIDLLRKGLARVLIQPDRRECVSELYAAEADARARHVGIWTSSAYAIRSAANVSDSDLGTFQIVEGRVMNASVHGGRAYLNLGADWKSDFTATISADDMKTFRDSNIDPATYYTGKSIRVRGIVEKMNGPDIEVSSPDLIEMLPDLRPAQK